MIFVSILEQFHLIEKIKNTSFSLKKAVSLNQCTIENYYPFYIVRCGDF